MGARQRFTAPVAVSSGLAAVLVTACILLAPAAAVGAVSTFTWYASGSANSNLSCWQRGSPSPAPSGVATPAIASTTCASIALPSHTVGGTGTSGGGIGSDIPLAPGDYCNYYKIGDTLGPDPTDESSWTGFAPTLLPLQSYQMGDRVGDVCQSTGAEWGLAVATNVPGNACSMYCGVHHYASFNAPSINNRPWDAWFGDPSLVVATSVDVHAWTTHAPANGWGYVCPVLQDTTSGWTIEYCIEEWRVNYQSDVQPPPACGTGTGSNDQVIAMLPSGSGSSDWASVYPGSSNTVDVATQPSGWFQITASIQVPELENAISAVHATCAGSPLSSDPRDYKLIGVEQGLEAGGTSFNTGDATQNLQLYTIYTFSNAPTNGAAPYISGQPATNSPAYADPGSWSGTPTYAYQWNRCGSNGADCSAIPGATQATYTPGASDVGATLTVTVAAGGPVSSSRYLAWSGPVTSAPSAPIEGPPSGGTPTTQGKPEVAQTPIESHGTWSNAPASYSGSGSGSGSGSSQGGASCLVPRLNHMTLSQVKWALRFAHCRLGKVLRPRHVRRHQVLRVSSQSVRSHTTHRANFPVNITLG
jgi:hypothetical protein